MLTATSSSAVANKMTVRAMDKTKANESSSDVSELEHAPSPSQPMPIEWSRQSFFCQRGKHPVFTQPSKNHKHRVYSVSACVCVGHSLTRCTENTVRDKNQFHFVSSKRNRYKCLSNGQHFDLTQKLLHSTLLRELFCVVPLSLWYLIAKHTWHPQQQRKWSVEWVGWISLDPSTFNYLANIALS